MKGDKLFRNNSKILETSGIKIQTKRADYNSRNFTLEAKDQNLNKKNAEQFK